MASIGYITTAHTPGCCSEAGGDLLIVGVKLHRPLLLRQSVKFYHGSSCTVRSWLPTGDTQSLNTTSTVCSLPTQPCCLVCVSSVSSRFCVWGAEEVTVWRSRRAIARAHRAPLCVDWGFSKWRQWLMHRPASTQHTYTQLGCGSHWRIIHPVYPYLPLSCFGINFVKSEIGFKKTLSSMWEAIYTFVAAV